MALPFIVVDVDVRIPTRLYNALWLPTSANLQRLSRRPATSVPASGPTHASHPSPGERAAAEAPLLFRERSGVPMKNVGCGQFGR